MTPPMSMIEKCATVADDREDAERWRALLRCPRVRMWGSAGFDRDTGNRRPEDEGNWVHFGGEFWSEYRMSEEQVAQTAPANEWSRRALTALADRIRENEARAMISAALTQEGGV
jgi:hypothetical protein